MDTPKKHQCPSVFPEWPESEVFAVVAGTPDEPQVAYLDKPKPVDDDLLRLTEPVTPTEVFRFTGPCAGPQCAHFDSNQQKCQLASRVIHWIPVAVDKLPACAIRRDCVWWNQEGRVACMRCPQVVSNNYAPTEIFSKAARPSEQSD